MTTSSDRRWFKAWLVAASLAIATPAAAQSAEPSAADLESARELYREGKDLRQKGDLHGALERFKAAHQYGQTPVTGLELGKTHAQLGELVEAREVLLSVGRLRVASDETEKSASARDEAASLAEQLRGRIPTLVVKIVGVKQDAAADVRIDGNATPFVGGSSTRRTNPGDHTIVVQAAGREEKRAVTLAEGETKEVLVTISDASPRIGGAPAADATPSQGSSRHPLVWVGVGLGAVGVAVGSVAGILALGKASSVHDACSGLACPASAKSNVDAGRTDATISTIGFVAAGAGVALAAVGLFVLSPGRTTARQTPSDRSVGVAVSPSWAGVHGKF